MKNPNCHFSDSLDAGREIRRRRKDRTKIKPESETRAAAPRRRKIARRSSGHRKSLRSVDTASGEVWDSHSREGAVANMIERLLESGGRRGTGERFVWTVTGERIREGETERERKRVHAE
ncbi:unnamed protein product [Sphenostylis stenocarpa]|uniref:Uncharacterized protein n=1 Tax=Sphenostylis stenocarpa TaxID=92480 RepID=A0AA86VAX5_9FABA|nr:unnamed protein product [Sphenostylis stenocarpa]